MSSHSLVLGFFSNPDLQPSKLLGREKDKVNVAENKDALVLE